jgi:hypothetical protein
MRFTAWVRAKSRGILLGFLARFLEGFAQGWLQGFMLGSLSCCKDSCKVPARKSLRNGSGYLPCVMKLSEME